MRVLASLDRRLLGHLLVGAVVAVGCAYAATQLLGIAPESQDSHAYYLADPLHPYVRATVGGDYAFLYSPLFAQAIEPLRLLGWPLFAAVWTLFLTACLVWAAGPWGLLLLIFQPVIASIALGNIELPIAAAIVLGFRWPAAWSFVLLSKLTPGIGLVWFAARREWRHLALALGATALLAAVSFAFAPGLWFDWASVLLANRDTQVHLWTLPGPIWLRVTVAGILVTWGARTDRRWTVPVGAAIALPVGWGTLFAVVAVGVVGVLRREADEVDRQWLVPLLRRVGLPSLARLAAGRPGGPT